MSEPAARNPGGFPARDAETLFHGLAGLVSELVFATDATGVLTYASEAAIPMFGWQPGEMVGRHFSEFLSETSMAPAMAAFEAEMIRREPSVALSLILRGRDGGVFTGEVNSSALVRDGAAVGIFGLIRDVTETRTAEKALRESEQRYRVLFESINDAVFVNEAVPGGEPGRFLQVNDVACRRLGYTRDELLALSPRDISTPEAFGQAAQHRAALADSGSTIMETVHVAKDGRRIHVESSIRYFQYLGRPAALSISRDLTDRKRAEAERLEMERRMQHVQKLESLGVLAGGIAHDFNNILVAVLGYADLALLELPARSHVRERIAEIETAAQRAAELCRQMLAYSGRGRFVIEALRLSDLVADTMPLLKASISKKAILNLDLKAGLPPIEGDAIQIRQVLMNLLTNASEAVADLGGVITVSTGAMHCTEEYVARTVVAEGLRAGHYVYLEVSDTGCGMDEETVGRIFEPFFTTKFTGRGLGMAAVLGIVRGHKGAIEICSKVGHGTTFRVLFPAGEGVVPASPPAEGRTLFTPWSGDGCVLLVDDEEPVRGLASRMLERMGFEVIQAADGHEALNEYQRHANRISLVLLDLTMPGMDGEETFRALRRISPTVPVVMSSGFTEQEITARVAGQGLAGFLQKPYSLATLQEKIRQAIGRP